MKYENGSHEHLGKVFQGFEISLYLMHWILSAKEVKEYYRVRKDTHSHWPGTEVRCGKIK